MILAPTLSLNTPARGYDADATAFAAASGATDVAALSAFVKGVKELGFWNNMVCWPLRSSQNAGTGTTAYSLGGLGTYNGTLTNGPTWSNNGIVCDGTNDYILNASLTNNGSGTLFVTAFTSFMPTNGNEARLASFSGGIEIGGTVTGVNSLGIEAFYLSSPFSGVGRNVAAASNILSRWFTAQGVFKNNESIARFIDGLDKQSTAIATNYPSVTSFSLGRRSNNTLFLNGTIAFGAYWTIAMTDSQVDSVNTLYKTTLGSGLGLP